MDTLQLSVIQIVPVANDAILVQLREINGRPVQYLAGQFLSFIFDFHGKELRRSYSICSSPDLDQELTILIKRVENGAVSRYLVDQLQPGDLLTALPPAGRFTITTDPLLERTICFFAAGSGISPIFSLLQQVLAKEPLSTVILVFQNRQESSVIFGKELEKIKQRFPERFTIVNLYSNPVDPVYHPQRLNNSLLEKLVNKYVDLSKPHEFYLCGPLSYMRMIQFVLRVMGVHEEHIRRENFVIEALAPNRFVLDNKPRKVTVIHKDTNWQFEVSYPETILTAALKHNIRMPFSCRAGRCSSCVVLCVEGKMKMSVNEVLTEKDLQEGLVLTCVGYAESDLVLRL